MKFVSVIESPRLKFLKISPAHFEQFYQLDIDPDVMKFIRQPALSREEAKERFNRLLDYSNKFPHLGGFMLFTHQDEFIGMGVLIHIELNLESKDYEVGYRLATHNWGKGYATEVAASLIDYAFKTLKLAEVYGTTHPDHMVSQKVLKKVGMQEHGSGSFYGGCKIFKIINGHHHGQQ